MLKRRSVIPPSFFDLGGVVPDGVLASELGVSTSTLNRWRRLCRIAPVVRTGAAGVPLSGPGLAIVTINVTPALKERMNSAARTAGVSTSSWVRRAARGALAGTCEGDEP